MNVEIMWIQAVVCKRTAVLCGDNKERAEEGNK